MLSSFLASLSPEGENQDGLADPFSAAGTMKKRPRTSRSQDISSESVDKKITNDTPEAEIDNDCASKPDQQKEGRTIFVGNVPLSLLKRKGVLKKQFAQFGVVESVRMRSVAVTATGVPSKSDYKVMRRVASNKGNVAENSTSCNAYVVYASTDGATEAVARGDGMRLEGHTLRVDRLRSDGGGQIFDRRRTVFVGNLPYSATDEAVRLYFESFLGFDAETDESSPVESVRLIRDRATNVGKGIGYVMLRTSSLGMRALGANGEEFEKRSIRVSRAERSAGMKRNRNVSGGGADSADGKRKKSSYEGTRSEHPAQRRIFRKKGKKGGAKKKSKAGNKKGKKRSKHD